MEEEKQDKTSIDKPKRDEKGRLLPGYTANPNGGPTMTEEEKIIRKATKKVIEAYEDKLAGMLPQLEPVLRKKALSGDMMAIKEVHDRVMGKAVQRIGNPDGSNLFPPQEKREKAKEAIDNYLENDHPRNNIGERPPNEESAIPLQPTE